MLKDIDLEQSVVDRFKKKGLKRKERKEIVTREEGFIEAHEGGDLSFFSIQIPELP